MGFIYSLPPVGLHGAEHGGLGPFEVHFGLLEAGLAQPANLILGGVGQVFVADPVVAQLRRTSSRARDRRRARARRASR